MVPPTIRLQPAVVEIDGSILVSSFLSVTDADGDPITLYEFRDNGAGGGYFELNGVRVNSPTNQFFQITPEQLRNLAYRGGSAKGRESITVRVTDSTLTTNSRTTSITTGNSSPVVIGRNFRVTAGQDQRMDGVIAITDADGDGIRQYGFVDRSIAVDSGHFYLDGVEQPQGRWLFVPAADLSKVTYRGGAVGRRVERLGVLVYDGFSYSEIGELDATTSGKPVVTAGSESEVLVGEKLAATDVFNVSDADGDSIRHYFISDRSARAGGGYWEFKGRRQQEAKFFRVLQSELDELFYVGGTSSPQVENVAITAFDGFDYSDIVNLPVRTVSRPSVNPPVVLPNTVEVQANRSVPASELFRASDPDGDPIDRYWLNDRGSSATSGYFEVDGVRQPSGRFFSVNAEEFEKVRYVGGKFGLQSEQIGVTVRAAGRLSDIVNVAVSTLPNLNAPEVQLSDIRERIGTTINARDLFTYTDVEDNPILRFGVYDSSTTGGFFTVDGVRQPGRQWLILDFDQIDTVEYNVGATPGTETLAMFLNDGRGSELAFGTATAFQDIIRVVENDISIDTLELVDFQPLVEQFQDYTLFQVFDENLSAVDSPVQEEDRSAKLLLDGNPLDANVIHSLTPEEFGRLQIRGAEVDLGRRIDPIVFRASTGENNFSEWERINVNTDPVGGDSLISTTGGAERQQPDLVDVPGVPDQNKHVITYTFVDGGNQVRRDQVPVGDPPVPIYYAENATERKETLALNQMQRESIRASLDNFEVYANIDFVEVPFDINASRAQLTFGTALLPEVVGAWAYLPNGIGAQGDSRGTISGDIWYNNLYYSPIPEFDDDGNLIEPREVGLGTQFYATTLHEIGHALGFKHPFDGAPALSIFNNFEYNTVMAYNSDSFDNPESSHPLPPATLMLYDIVRLQELYGVNEVYNPGDDVYAFDRDLQQTLYDTDGFDFLDYSDSVFDEKIDLREGQWSTIQGNEDGTDTDLSLRIAYGVTIEGVLGGVGSDVIQGNEVGNILRGNDGNDTILGAGANDQLFGGAGDDLYVWRFGDGRDAIREEGAGGTDTLEIRDSSNTFVGLEQGLVFRRLGNDLRIDLRIEGQAAQGTVLIKDYATAGSEVETLALRAANGDAIGPDIDLTSIFSVADETFQRFAVTAQQGSFGALAVPA